MVVGGRRVIEPSKTSLGREDSDSLAGMPTANWLTSVLFRVGLDLQLAEIPQHDGRLKGGGGAPLACRDRYHFAVVRRTDLRIGQGGFQPLHVEPSHLEIICQKRVGCLVQSVQRELRLLDLLLQDRDLESLIGESSAWSDRNWPLPGYS